MTRYNRAFWLTMGLLLAVTLFIIWIRPQIKVTPAIHTDYHDEVYRYAKQFDLDPALVFAVIKTESNFDPNARSHQDAYGLMQITESTLKWAILREGQGATHTIEDLYDPAINIKYGCLILSLLLGEFEAQDTALAAYNAGRGNALKWLKDSRYSDDGVHIKTTPFTETNDYIKKVNKYHLQYKEMLQ